MDERVDRSEMADKLAALQARLGTKFNVAGNAGRTQVLLEGMLFLAQAGSPLHANPREAFLTDDALLLIKQESMSRLAVQELPLSGLVVHDRLAAQIAGLTADPSASPPWSFALTPRPGTALGGDASAAPSLPIVLTAADKDSKELWLEHLGSAIAELLPGDLRLVPCWYHRFVVTGTLFSAAAGDDADLAAALVQASPSARGRGVSSLPFDDKTLPELDLDALEPAVAGGSGGTALHMAARAGSVRVLRSLLEGGASMAMQDGDLATPLHVALEASSHASLAAAAVLIANEAPFDARNLLDATPLHVALGRLVADASAPSPSAAAAVAAAPSATGAAAAEPAPAASLASAIADTVALMLQHGACPRTADADGLEPLHRLLTSPAAAAAGDGKLLSALVRAGADANAPVLLPDPAEAARSSGFGFSGASGAADPAATAGGAGGTAAAAPSALTTGRPTGEVAAPIHLALGVGAVWARTMTAATAAGSLSPSPAAAAAAPAVPAAAAAAALPGFAGAASTLLASGAPLLSQSVVAELLQLGAHPNARTVPGGETPLHLLLRILAAARTVGPAAGVSAAHVAAQAAEADACIGRLVAAGARADIADAAGATAAALADALGLRPVLDSAVARHTAAFAARAPPPAAAARVGTLGTLHKRRKAPEGELVAARRSRLGALTAVSSRPVGMALDAKHWSGDAAGGSGGSEGNACVPCGAGFTLLRRKHHCRHCGVLVCDKCSSKRFPLAPSSGAGGADSDDDGGGGGSESLSFGIPGMRVAGARGTGAGGTAGSGSAAGAGGDGPATTEERVCDGCFNRLCAAVEDADRRAAAWEREKAAALAQAPGRIAAAAAAAGGASGPARTVAAAGGAGSGTAAAGAAARPLPSSAPPPDAARAALFGGRTAAPGTGAAAAAPGSAAAVGSQAGHVGEVLSQARDRMVERGHRLANIEERSAKMADSAASFADAAAAIKKQAKGSSGIAGWFGL